MRTQPTILGQGVLSGLVAGGCVLAVFSVYDLFTSELMRTPSVLYTHLFHGIEAAKSAQPDFVYTLLYTLVHFAVWIAAGVCAAYVAAFRQIFPGLWSALVLGPSLIFGVFLWAAGVWGVPGLGVHHFWVGALLGGLAMAWVLLHGNDGVLEGIED